MPTTTATTTTPLTSHQLEVLEFERTTWSPSSAGRKITAIHDWLGMDETRYAQILTVVAASPAAEAYDAQLVRRIQRQLAGRAAGRHRPDRPIGGGW